ncbi:alpha-amylase family glycosyl hydrolase [Spirosoma sp.]|uniref:alpha-amylase family glycosyl hydrolase n=1 Tax=Spirosoma sp. TaxID=1899569 RepID=UPI003B3A9858
MMSQLIINRRTLGVTFTADHQANVVVWVPQAKEVALSINGHAINLPLTKGSSGYWQLTTDQLKPGDTYKFVLDNEKEWADPTSLLQPQGVYGPSQAFDTKYVYWEDSSWVNPPIDEYIVYDINIHTFTAEGTLKAIVGKLSHIKKLGVNAILIRPVTPFPDSRNQNLEAAFLFAVQASYGGPGQLQRLVNACHFEGLSVILDLPYKQVNQSEYVLSEGSVFSARKLTADRSKAESGNEASREAYGRHLVENALMWFRDFHVDALRLENVHTLPDADQLLRTIREQTNALTAQTGRQHYLLIEQDMTLMPSGTKQSDREKKNISDHQQKLSGKSCNAYYMDFNHNRHKTKQYRKDCLCDSTFSTILQELFEREADTASDDAFVTILQTYHQTDKEQLSEHSDREIDGEFVKLVAGSIMVSPCIPTLFMGEEWGVTSPFQKLTHSEPVLAASEPVELTENRDELMLVLPWESLNEIPNQTLYRYYQSLTALRRKQPALYHLNPKQARVIYQDGESTLFLHRSYKTNHVLCLMNFSSEKQTVTLPALGKNWQKLLDSADPIWNGPEASPELLTDASQLTLQPESIVVYKGGV